MKIVILLLALVAAFCFAMKKTVDSRVQLAERLQAEQIISNAGKAAAIPPLVTLL